MNQPNQPNPKQGTQENKQDKQAQKAAQQMQQGNRPAQQGGYNSPGHGAPPGQSAPTDKK